MKVLAERLLQSAQLFVCSALAAYDAGEAHIFLLHAGTALEHLLKARLADLNPVLISKRDHVASLVWFADETKHAVHPLGMRTITLDESLSLVTALNVPISAYRDKVTNLQHFRNGVAHFGVIDHTTSYAILPAFLHTVIVLLNELDVSDSAFFGAYDEFVSSQLAQHRSQEERDYEGRVAQAKMRFLSEHGQLEAPALEHLGQLAEMRWHRRSLEDQLVDCPVCGLPAYTEGILEQVDWDVDFDREGNPEGASVVLQFQAADLRCPTCGLVLDTASLVNMSGALENWELSDGDYDAFMRDMYEEERGWYDFP